MFPLVTSSSLALDSKWLSWCGKHYQPGSPAVPPLGKMNPPERSSIPLLDFRCTPTIQPYLSTDLSASILLDLYTSWTHGVPLTSTDMVLDQESGINWIQTDGSSYQVFVSAKTASSHSETYPLLASSISLNSTTEAFFDISLLPPAVEPYTITCSLLPLPQGLISENRLIETTSLLRILPETNPWGGSTTRIDRRKGSILVPVNGGWEPILPVGFYTNYGDYLAKDLSHLDEMKKLGFNTVHPVPTFDDIDILKKVLDHAEKIGLWLMYDMRHTYTDSVKVKDQVKMIQSYKNLLVWYTADEPDGNEDSLSSTRTAYDLIYDLDKGYHPVSLVLNCADYFFADHVSGADIVLIDTYSFNVNLTFSSTWHTPCNETYGCCGCDNCYYGGARDVSERLDQMNKFRTWLGWERRITFWGVPQAFGGSEYWTSEPTTQELLLSSILGLIHGTKGIIPWVAPTSDSLTSAFSTLSNHITNTLSRVILSPEHVDSPIDTSLAHRTSILLAGQTRTRLSSCWPISGTRWNTWKSS
ncbi:Glycoside hydrolase, superfamily [Phaffia rhodozyma]|uniref:Glycoside hydrolase, superfamily n=1 Tax=Phaffia rhodozyma TaxID=264483 RepID=A0A0F7SMC7_PHARH|nr:Glycoside hydrolase, superfamily [Phaffia rhodozyma]